MKDFLKNKPKENFDEPPKMPEDIRELYMQRQHEMSEERTSLVAAASKGTGDGDKTAPSVTVEPKLEQITLPPPPGEGLTTSTPAETAPKKSEPTAPRVNPRDETAPPPPPATRPRVAEPAKKKGKKGANEP
jgi:hypothetical protein